MKNINKYRGTKFKLYRYTMTKTKKSPLPLESKNKFELIKDLFLKKEVYLSEDQKLVYSKVYSSDNEKIIVAKIAKRKIIKIHGSPKNDFREQNQDDWPNSYLIINTDDDSVTGQVIAFEHNPTYFVNPFSILENLRKKFNESLFASGWMLEIEPISSKISFWNFVEENRGNIQELVFDFNTPNLFNEKSTLQDELKAAKEDINATNMEIKLKNDVGSLDIKQDGLLGSFFNQSVDYIQKGGGGWRMKKVGKKGKIKSTDKEVLEIVKTVEIDADAQKYLDEVVNSGQTSIDENDLIVNKIIKSLKENEDK